MPQQIVKRDGRIESWSVDRIAQAILKSLNASGIKDPLLAKRLAGKVEGKLDGMESPEQELVQDTVEQVLMESRLYRVPREAPPDPQPDRDLPGRDRDHRQLHEQVRLAGQREREHGPLLPGTDAPPVRLRAGALLPGEIPRGGPSGLAGYCAGWSLRDLLLEGFNLEGRCSSGPSRHFDAALGQMVNFLGTLQNEWAGAQAFNNVDTYLAPFVRHDGLSYDEVKQAMQKFVFNLNTTSRWGGQSPFTNLTFDLTPPAHIASEAVIIGGALQDNTYGEYVEEMEMINRAFLEVMLKGDYHGRIFSFPIPTYNVTPDFPWESEVGELLLKLTAKYGVPYFQNFINSDLKPEDVRSMCCRLQMDLRELRKRTGGLFGAGDLTGSIGVVTLNLPKLAYLAQGEEDFLDLVGEYAALAKDSLEFKRKMVADNMDKGMFPFTRRYLKNGFRGHFSTIGILGGHEACLNLLGKGIETDAGTRLMIRTLDHLRGMTARFQEETGNLYNLEATPAEGTSYRLAKLDKKNFPGIVTAGTDEVPYYTNSTQLPVGATTDIFDALDHQDPLQVLYTGGTVFHGFIGERIADPLVARDLVRHVASHYKLPYFTITPTFSVCPVHKYISGEHFECPSCGERTEVYSRVVGFHRPVASWNVGKKEEFAARTEFVVAEVPAGE